MSLDKNDEVIVERAKTVLDRGNKPPDASRRQTDGGTNTPRDLPELPVDCGWAWMILLGSMLQMTLIVGLQKSSGILFVAFQRRFNSTSSMTSLLSTMQNAAYSLSAPVVMTVGLKMASPRSMLFIGSIMTTLSYVISAYVDRIQVLLFSYGVMQGIGMAFMVPPSVSVLGTFFRKRRGLANSLAVSGASIGGFILAPLITHLLSTYGYHGCMLVIGAILLNGCVSGALFRPQSFYRRTTTGTLTSKYREKLITPSNEKYTGTDNDSGFTGLTGAKALLEPCNINAKPRRGKRPDSLETEMLFKSLPDLSNDQPPFRNRTSTNTSHMDRLINLNKSTLDSNGDIYKSMDFIKSSFLDMTADPNNVCKEHQSTTLKTDNIKEIFRTFIHSFDFNLFKMPLFVLLLVLAFFICSSSLLAVIFLAPHANDIGINAKGIATLVTVFSGTDLISRIVIGVISDKGWLRRSTIVGISALIQGVAAQFVVFFSSFYLLMVYAVMLGVFSGAYFALFPVVIVDYLTLERLNSALGFVALCNGAGISLMFYLMGYIRDVTGSYIASYHVVGTMCLIGGALSLLLPLFDKTNTKTVQTEQTLE